MADKILNTRILLKYDSYENWLSNNPTLKKGEVAIATIPSNQDGVQNAPSVLIKVGDGESDYKTLKFVSGLAADVYSWAKAEKKPTYEAKEITGISDYIADYVETEMGISVDTDTQYQIVKVDDYNYKLQSKGKGDSAWADVTGSTIVIPNDTAAIEALEQLVGTTSVATQIANAIAALDLANTYEAKGEAAKVQSALDTYKNSNDAKILEHTNAIGANTNALTAIKDGETLDSFKDVETALAGKEASGAAAQALADAKSYADGLADNYDAKGAAATAESNAKAYADGLAGNYDAAGSAAAVQSKLDEEVTRAKKAEEANASAIEALEGLVGTDSVSAQVSAAITDLDLPNTYAAKVHKHVKADITDFAHNHEIGEVNGLQAALDGKQAAGDYATKAEAQAMADGKDAAIAAAKKAGDDAQADVDALELYVGTIPETAEATNIVAYVQEKTAGIATDAALGELTGRVTAAEGAIDAIEADYLKTADKTALQDQITENAGAISDLEGLVGTTSVATQISDAVAAEAAIARAAEKANADAIDAIEADYLKASDKAELQNQINTIMNNPDTEGVINSINEFTQYIADHGEIAEGFRTDIDANAAAIEAIEGDYLKAADKNALQGEIDAVEGRMDTAEGKIAALEGSVATKAAQADLEALAGRVTTAEGKVTTLEGEMDAAQGDITALEGLVGTTAVSAQIEAAIEALKIGDYAKAADLTAAVARVAQNETDIDALEGRMGTAEGEIDALQTEIAKKTNDADLAAVAKSGLIDDLSIGEGTTLIFDCGDSNI